MSRKGLFVPPELQPAEMALLKHFPSTKARIEQIEVPARIEFIRRYETVITKRLATDHDLYEGLLDHLQVSRVEATGGGNPALAAHSFVRPQEVWDPTRVSDEE